MPWCGRWDSNPHGFLHQNLNLACLPFHHARIYIDSVSHAATKSTGKTDIRAKNTHPPRRPYRKTDSRGDTEPSGGKRSEEEGEKPIGRIGKRREKRDRSSPSIGKGTLGGRRWYRVLPSRIGGGDTANRIEISDAATRENDTGGGEIWEGEPHIVIK